jgi:LmbE family N-acetylglucosaminyl deacetylase
MERTDPVAIVVPHQDDEMFIFHRMRVLLSQQRSLHLVWVTDGAAHSEALRKDFMIRLFFPILSRCSNAAIRAVRAQESRELARRLGIPQNRLHFLDHPSGKLQHCFDSLVNSLSKVLGALQPSEIYTVAYDHSHFEHDACNAAVRFAANPGSTCYEFPVINLDRGIARHRWLLPCAGGRVERTPFSGEEERQRLYLLRRVFRSQWSVALLELCASWFKSEYQRLGEPYRIMPEHDYTQPLRASALHYLPKSLRFEDFKKMVRPYVSGN